MTGIEYELKTNGETKQIPDEEQPLKEQSDVKQECDIYTRRWLILFLFMMMSGLNALQWVQYSIIGNVITKFYNLEGTSWVEWTSEIYMLTYIFLFIPGSWALDKFGMRICVIIGTAGTCIGAWIKVLTVSPHLFYVQFLGQTIVAMSQVFVLSIPSRLAAVWFGADQVSTACSLGVFGNLLGIAVGFVLPPMLVDGSDSLDVIETNLGWMFRGVASIASVVLVLIVIFYEEKPPLPPSLAALKQSENEQDFLGSLKRLSTNVGYIYLLVSNAINIGVFCAISTLLNKVILAYYPDGGQDAGRIGLLMILAGMVGSVVCGYILDATHKYKETTLVVYFLTLAGMVAFSFTIDSGMVVVYITSGILGFAMTGYMPLGYEVAAELTYPEPEGTSGGILNGVVQIFGLVLTSGYSYFITEFGVYTANISLCVALAIGLGLTALLPTKQRRQEATKSS